MLVRKIRFFCVSKKAKMSNTMAIAAAPTGRRPPPGSPLPPSLSILAAGEGHLGPAPGQSPELNVRDEKWRSLGAQNKTNTISIAL